MAEFNPTSTYQYLLIKESVRKLGKKKGTRQALNQIRSIGRLGVDMHTIDKMMEYHRKPT